MRLSTERILTTHVGSLPRTRDVVELLYKKENGEDYDRAAYDAAVAAGVADAVAKQVAAGIDVVSDGETSKVGYSTYIKDRLSGFAGHHPRPPHLDLAPYPEFREAMARMIGKQSFKRAGCVGPIALTDPAAMQVDIANLRAALEAHGKSTVDWVSLAADYDRIREHIEHVVPGFVQYNARVRQPGGFYLPNPVREGVFPTPSKRAQFSRVPIPEHELPPGQLLLTTLRSHDQFNTTIYGEGDRYRGISGGRRVIFLNPDDMRERALQK